MAVNYRDNTPFEGDNHTVGELANAIRTKMYGVDVREPIAQAVEKMENWTKGNNIGQIIATPTKVFATLSDLQEAYPNGTEGVMLTADDGHKYFWSDNQWTDGGVYQSLGLSQSETEKLTNTASDFLNFSNTSDRVDLNNSVNASEIVSMFLPMNSSGLEYVSYHFPDFPSSQPDALGILENYDFSYNNDLLQKLTLNPGGTYIRRRIGTNNWYAWEKIGAESIDSARFFGYGISGVSSKTPSEINYDEISYFDGSDEQASDGWPKSAYGVACVSVKNVTSSTIVKKILEIQIITNYNNHFWGFVKPDGTVIWTSNNETMPEKYGQVSKSDFDANEIFTNFLFIVDGNREQKNAVHVPEDLTTNVGFAYMHVYRHGANNFLQEITTDTGKWLRQRNAANGWGVWSNVANSNKTYMHALDAPQKFAVIGDSLTVGMAGDNNQNRNEWYSWPQYIARKAGNTAVNLGTAGDTVISWFTTNASHGKDKALLPENKAQLYVIELSRNDALNKLTVGTASDIVHASTANNVTTFYGGYSRILSLIHEINPQAVVVAVTDPGVQTADGDACADAIKNIAKDDFFKNWVLLVDLHNDPTAVREYKQLNQGMTYSTGGSHPNQISYTGYAEFYNTKIAEAWPNSQLREIDFSKIDY